MTKGTKLLINNDIANCLLQELGISFAEALKLVEEYNRENVEIEEEEAEKTRANLRQIFKTPGELERFIEEFEGYQLECGTTNA
jgi:hypothetical protein